MRFIPFGFMRGDIVSSPLLYNNFLLSSAQKLMTPPYDKVLILSTDGGITFTEIANIGPSNDIVSCLSSDGNTIYYGVYFDSSVYKSTDRGLNWTTLSWTTDLPINNMKCSADGETLAVYTRYEPNLESKIAVSNDGGATKTEFFRNITTPAGNKNVVLTNGDLIKSGFPILGAGYQENNTFLRQQPISILTGMTSTVSTISGSGSQRYTQACISDNSQIIMGAVNGTTGSLGTGKVFISTNGGVSFVNSPIGDALYNPTIRMSSTGNIMLMTSNAFGGITYLSTDSGTTFNQVTSLNNVLALNNLSMSYDGKYMYVRNNNFTSNFNLFISSDYGSTWNETVISNFFDFENLSTNKSPF